MQVITAKDAKSRFGELLDTMQREPVLVTKNKRPVGHHNRRNRDSPQCSGRIPAA